VNWFRGRSALHSLSTGDLTGFWAAKDTELYDCGLNKGVSAVVQPPTWSAKVDRLPARTVRPSSAARRHRRSRMRCTPCAVPKLGSVA
jgi:hypothetical protein